MDVEKTSFLRLNRNAEQLAFEGYPFESDEHYEERREAFNQGYGTIDPTPCLSAISSVMTVETASL
jgi:hypothetical protein